MADARVDMVESGEERPVLAYLDRGDAARAMKGSRFHRNAGTGFVAVARPRVGFIGIDRGADVIQQGCIGAFENVVFVQRLGDQQGLDRIDHSLTGHGIGTPRERSQVAGDPIRGDASVSIRRQKDAVRGEGRRTRHGEASRVSGAALPGRQACLDQVDIERQVGSETTHEIGGAISAIVQEQHDRERRRMALIGEGAEANAEAFTFILHRNRNRDPGRGTRSRRNHRDDPGFERPCMWGGQSVWTCLMRSHRRVTAGERRDAADAYGGRLRRDAMAEHVVARFRDIPDGGMKPVEIAGIKIVLIRQGDAVHALAGECPHAGAPLHEGAVCNGRLICPWHSGTFEIETGALVEPPPMQALARFGARVAGDNVLVDPAPRLPPSVTRRSNRDRRTAALIGNGAAAAMAATSLREFGFEGRIVMIGPNKEEPIDRTLLSKQSMSGEMGLEALPLWSGPEAERLGVERLTAEVTALDAPAMRLMLSEGPDVLYDLALIATGGRPRQLDVPGNDLPGVFTLRHRADLEAILRQAETTDRAVIVGTSFIGMEVAGSLTQRGLKVAVAGPEDLPFAKQFGPELAGALKRLHERKGVAFHLQSEVARFEGTDRLEAVMLASGERLATNLAVIGIGVRPATNFVSGVRKAEDGGIIVDRHLRADAPGLYAAGDVAVFPGLGGAPLRIEHWRVAEQQGRAAARNMLGIAEAYARVPFFWTTQQDAVIDYVGHAKNWDEIVIDGDLSALDFLAFYMTDGFVDAAATGGRDRQTALLSELLRERWRLPALRARLAG
jgi:NADPH-dependent 2,4-dienoyl-CoA reductase/sulfur reductase-like enzyme/nitrite reductase/ring-hydroxylating ferredoxin subunit